MVQLDQSVKSASSEALRMGSSKTNIGHEDHDERGSATSVRIDGRQVLVTGTWLKTSMVQDEDLVEGELVADPASFINRLKASRLKADLFTFPQNLPDTEPKHSLHTEWGNWAVIPITTYSEWWQKRVESSVRRAVRKAEKEGVVTEQVEFEDAFVGGIVNINNETPIRQGRPFWHYHKDFATVKAENSTYAERNTFLGAYLKGELIGFIRLTRANTVAHIIQLLTMTKHFDKRPANALIAKAVEVCAKQGLSYLTYRNYTYNDPNSSLTEFKRRSGFEKVLVPRYYVPLTPVGKIALRLGLHRGLVKCIPQPILTRLLTVRNEWYSRKAKSEEGSN